MLPKHQHLLRKIVSSGRLVLTRSEGQSSSSYLADDALRALVVRKVEIIGEDLIRLRDADPALVRRMTGVDQVIGLRNLIAYEDETYPGDRLWQDAVDLLPALVASVERLLVAAAGIDA